MSYSRQHLAMWFEIIETPTDDVNGVATKTSDGAPTVRKSIFGVDEQGCFGKSVLDGWETVSECTLLQKKLPTTTWKHCRKL